MNPKSADIYSQPNLEGELHQFLIRNPQQAQELARRTQGMGPKESMAIIAQAMWESQWAAGKPGRQPGSWGCICGKVISRNKKYCKACEDKERTKNNAQDVQDRTRPAAGSADHGPEVSEPSPGSAD